MERAKVRETDNSKLGRRFGVRVSRADNVRLRAPAAKVESEVPTKKVAKKKTESKKG